MIPRVGLLVQLTIVVLVGCGPIELPFGGHDPLPTATATLHWARVTLPRGSYCWSTGGTATCADAASVDALLRTGHLKPYRTAGGFSVSLRFSSAPSSFSVRLISGPSGAPRPQQSGGTFGVPVVPPAPAGVYVYDVSATWSAGKVDFFLPLDLVPGSA